MSSRQNFGCTSPFNLFTTYLIISFSHISQYLIISFSHISQYLIILLSHYLILSFSHISFSHISLSHSLISLISLNNFHFQPLTYFSHSLFSYPIQAHQNSPKLRCPNLMSVPSMMACCAYQTTSIRRIIRYHYKRPVDT